MRKLSGLISLWMKLFECTNSIRLRITHTHTHLFVSRHSVGQDVKMIATGTAHPQINERWHTRSERKRPVHNALSTHQHGCVCTEHAKSRSCKLHSHPRAHQQHLILPHPAHRQQNSDRQTQADFQNIAIIVNYAGGGAQLSSFVPSSFERLVTATWSLNFVRATKLLATHPDRAQLTVASDRTASHSRSPPKLLRSCYEAPANIKPEVLSSESTTRR